MPGLHVPAVWHASLAAQTTGVDPVHTPDWQESLCVQAFPSLHAVPFGRAGLEQTPLEGLQLPAAWQASPATQVTGLDPVHAPLWHVSVWVHAFPSLHVVPFAAAGFEHAPVAGLQVPATWHVSSAAQVTGSDPVHAPLWHVSLCVQALPSLQFVPLGASGIGTCAARRIAGPGDMAPVARRAGDRARPEARAGLARIHLVALVRPRAARAVRRPRCGCTCRRRCTRRRCTGSRRHTSRPSSTRRRPRRCSYRSGRWRFRSPGSTCRRWTRTWSTRWPG